MGLLLPVLLLGLLPPAEQPASQPKTQPGAQVLPTLSSAAPASPKNGVQAGQRQQQPFDRIEPDLGQPIANTEMCLTLRSYYFERQDDLAPELKGMTTCENARKIRDRNAKKGQKPRLVPATGGPAN